MTSKSSLSNSVKSSVEALYERSGIYHHAFQRKPAIPYPEKQDHDLRMADYSGFSFQGQYHPPLGWVDCH